MSVLKINKIIYVVLGGFMTSSLMLQYEWSEITSISGSFGGQKAQTPKETSQTSKSRGHKVFLR
jgi:hypothetical protein